MNRPYLLMAVRQKQLLTDAAHTVASCLTETSVPLLQDVGQLLDLEPREGKLKMKYQMVHLSIKNSRRFC